WRDPAYDQWRGAMGHKTGAANAWSVLMADTERDLVFVPTGSAAPDYYGVLRLGDNRYANSIVALRASSGALVWAYQTVHHDLWGASDVDRAACHAAIDSLRNEGIFTPPSIRGTLAMPSNIGGAHWGGVAVDPVRQIAVVPVNRIAAVVQLIPRETFDHERAM